MLCRGIALTTRRDTQGDYFSRPSLDQVRVIMHGSQLLDDSGNRVGNVLTAAVKPEGQEFNLELLVNVSDAGMQHRVTAEPMYLWFNGEIKGTISESGCRVVNEVRSVQVTISPREKPDPSCGPVAVLTPSAI